MYIINKRDKRWMLMHELASVMNESKNVQTGRNQPWAVTSLLSLTTASMNINNNNNNNHIILLKMTPSRVSCSNNPKCTFLEWNHFHFLSGMRHIFRSKVCFCKKQKNMNILLLWTSALKRILPLRAALGFVWSRAS